MAKDSSRKNFWLSAIMAIATIAAVVLGYGYWHSVTHASFHIDLNMIAGPDGQRTPMPLAEITFFDTTGRELAKGLGDEKHNFVHLLHPQVGDCHEKAKALGAGKVEGREVWQECFAKMSVWIPQWANEVHTADVIYEDRTFTGIPVKVSSYNSEWMLWWVPLPHVGGKPYTYYRATIAVDATNKRSVQ